MGRLVFLCWVGLGSFTQLHSAKGSVGLEGPRGPDVSDVSGRWRWFSAGTWPVFQWLDCLPYTVVSGQGSKAVKAEGARSLET